MKAPLLLWLGPLVLAVLGHRRGCLPAPTHHFLSSPMASAVAGAPVEIDIIDRVPHFGLPLMLSVAHHRAGVAVYLVPGSRRAARLPACLTRSAGDPIAASTRPCAACCAVSFAVSRIVQNGRLDIYMTVTFIVIALALLVPMMLFDEWPAWPDWPQLLLPRMDGPRHRRDRPRRRRSRQQPPDGDRLARHPGFCRGAAVHAARRAGPVLHPVHDRDAVGRHPGAGDDAAETIAGWIAGRLARAGRTAPSQLPAGSASACCCSR